MFTKPDQPIRIAIAQILVKSYDIESNQQKHMEYIKLARKENADVLLFPELSLCGCHTGPEAYKTSITHKHPVIEELTKATGDMATIIGFIEEGFAAQFYNSSIILQQGQDPFIHRKMNLCTYGYWAEGKYFAQGRYLETFNLPAKFTGSVLICADLWNPALVHLSALHGTSIIFAPIASAEGAIVSPEFSNPDNWELALRFYAMIYGMPIVMANSVGQDGDLNFWGGSCVIDAFGNTQEKLDREEGLLVTELDYNQVLKARFQLPTVRDSNLGLIQREMKRLEDSLGVPVGIREAEHHFGKKR